MFCSLESHIISVPVYDVVVWVRYITVLLAHLEENLSTNEIRDPRPATDSSIIRCIYLSSCLGKERAQQTQDAIVEKKIMESGYQLDGLLFYL